MFLSPDVEVHRHESFLEIMTEGLLAVVGVKKAEEVPRGVNKCVHRVCFPLAVLATPVRRKGRVMGMVGEGGQHLCASVSVFCF